MKEWNDRAAKIVMDKNTIGRTITLFNKGSRQKEQIIPEVFAEMEKLIPANEPLVKRFNRFLLRCYS